MMIVMTNTIIWPLPYLDTMVLLQITTIIINIKEETLLIQFTANAPFNDFSFSSFFISFVNRFAYIMLLSFYFLYFTIDFMIITYKLPLLVDVVLTFLSHLCG